MTTENRRASSRPFVFLAALGLALVLSPSAATAAAYPIPIVSSTTLAIGTTGAYLAEARSGGVLFAVGYASAGVTGLNALISRYDENTLAFLSSSTYNGTANGTDAASGATVDGAGNLYVVGSSSKAGSGPVLWMAKFANSGALISSGTYNIPIAPNIQASPAGIVLSGGNVYAAHTTANAGVFKMVFAKFDSALNFISSTTFFNGFDSNYATGLTADSGGNIYAAGSVAPAPATSNDVWVGKFNSNLVFITSRTVAGPGGNSDAATTLRLDPSENNLFVTGYYNTSGPLGAIFLAKYTLSLAPLAQATFLGSGPAYSIGSGIAVTPSRVYVAGGTNTSTQGMDVFVGEFDYSLNLLSSSTLNSGGANSDQAYALELDPLGRFAYLAGVFSPGPNTPGVAKYHVPYDFATLEAVGISIAPVSVDGSGTDVAMLAVDMTASLSPASLSTLQLGMFGDLPYNLVSGAMWLDNGDGVFNSGTDTLIASNPFGPPTLASPPTATLNATGQNLSPGVTTRYFFTAHFTGAPSGRKVSFGFRQPSDVGPGSVSGSFPTTSNAVLIRSSVYANPVNGVSNYPYPVAGASSSGGLDTGIFVQSGQRVTAVPTPGDTWSVPAVVGPTGGAPTGGLNGAFNRGLLVGRIGSGAWFAIGAGSTITATSAGTLYAAPNDTNYTDNSGVIHVAFDLLPSTTPKQWLGGTLGFETRADIGTNWAGGRPFPGESVSFDSGAYNCDWNLPNVNVATLFVSTAYTGTITLVNPVNQYGNRLTVDGDALIRGGRFSLAASTAGVAAAAGFGMTVKGKLVVRDTATFDLDGQAMDLGVGAEFLAGATLTNAAGGSIGRAFPALAYYLRVDHATVNVTGGNTTLNGLDFLDFIDATVAAYDNVSFNTIGTSTNAIARIATSSKVNYVFNKWDAPPPVRMPYGLIANGVFAGSTVTFNDSTAIGSTGFGTPHTNDPFGSVRWNPDGGGTSGAISGTLAGAVASYLVVASTSPVRVDNPAAGGGGNTSVSPGAYTINSLRAPGTYYVFASVVSGGVQVPFSPAAGFGHPGILKSDPVYVSSTGATTSGINLSVNPWGVLTGTVTNQSSQSGPIVVETWEGLPNVVTSTRQARTIATPGFSFATPSDFGGVLHSSSVFVFVDANQNGAWDVFEASATVVPVNVSSVTETILGAISVFGGNPAPGGTVALSTQAVHLGYIGLTGPNALIRSRLTTTGGNAGLSAVKVRYQGSPLPPPGSEFAIWADDGDGIFDPSKDSKQGSAPIFVLGPSTYTVTLAQPYFLPSGSTRDFFLTLDVNSPFGSAVGGAMLDAATSYTLSAGTFSVTPAFPSQTGPLTALSVVSSSEPATSDGQGGAQAGGTFFFPQASISVTSTGTWRVSPTDPLVGPGGYPGTTGLNTVLPAANVGELIGRITNGGAATPWRRIGASTTPFLAGDYGVLRLAINDYVGAYGDNQGTILAGFATSGSSVGAISGQLFYSTPIGGTVTVTPRLNGTTPYASNAVSFAVSIATSYPFFIQGLPPGSYDLSASHGSSSDFGLSGQQVNVVAGATATLNAVMYQSTGAITGSLSYGGVIGQGDFHIGVATVTDFSGNVNFFGGFNGASASTYNITNLPTPATYYVVAYRDGNGDNKPDGPEPFGYWGAPGAGLGSLTAALTPIYLGPGLSSGGVSFPLNDLGAIEGNATLLPGATGTLILETGRGVFGSAAYTAENRVRIQLPNPVPAAGVFFSLGLLRPATNYSLFAFLDKNFDGQPSGGEEQLTSLSPIAVPPGGRGRFDFTMVSLSSPAAPALFTATPAAVSTIAFSWNLVPGATGYQLRRANNSVIFSLAASASDYFDVLPDNTSSQIRVITASNGNGTSTTTALAGPAYSLATVPSVPVVSAVSSSGALVTWGGTNPAGTLFDLQRATAPTGSTTLVFSGAATSFYNPLPPGSTYFWSVRAQNGNGVATAYTNMALANAVTLPLAGPALSGALSYPGAQTQSGTGHGFVIEASTSSTTFFPRASSAALAGLPLQPFYLPVSAGTYYVRAFVDVANNGVLQPGADRGSAGPFVVVASSVNASFSVGVDTVPPGAPAGLVAVPGFNKVTVSWAAPTKNANGSNLVDLAGYVVERSTAVSASFFSLTPVALSSTTGSFVDNAPLAGLPNYYRLRAVDLGGLQSSPSGVVSGAASAGGSISGTFRNFSTFVAATDGQFRVRLSTAPSSSAPSVAEASLTSYTFTGLADGVYYLRGFRDVNGNGVEDVQTEPGGTFGGLNLPFPISIVNGNAVSGADATICDRSPLTASSLGSLTAAGCPALDKGPGFSTQLFAFTVGGGGANSYGLGSQMNLSMSTATTFATEIILIGPNGSVFGRDNRVGGANLTVTLNQPGTYIVEPTSFLVGGAGSFELKTRVDGGFAGVISGSVTYAGARPGLIYTQLFNTPSSQALPILTSTAAAPPASFTFSGLPDGLYYLRSYRDSNGNGVSDIGEPFGQYGVSASSSLAISVAGGVVSGAPFNHVITDPAAGVVRGAALYEGTGTGPLRVEIGQPDCAGCSSLSQPIAFTTVAPGGVYTFPFIPAATGYVVRALADFNGNGRQDALEPAVSSSPVTVFVNATSTVSLIVRDAGAGAYGGAVVVGTVTYNGVSTGPIVIGLSRDPQFHTIDYLLVLPTTGSFNRAGLAGDATYYMAGFIDTNLNNNPDTDLGEPAAAGSTVPFAYTPSLSSPPPIYVAPNGATSVKLALLDPPSAQVFGVVSYAGVAPVSQNLVVQAYRASVAFDDEVHRVVIPRVPGVSTYSFHLGFLRAEDYYISSFVDANGNQQNDPGEPFGSRPSITLSSGAGSFPTYGANLEILDPGTLGPSLSAGRIHGEMVYLGVQSGPMYVRFFNNSSFSGTPLYTLRIPASGFPTPGSGEFQFDQQNLPFGDYYMDAFRDPSDLGVYRPASHAHGILNEGQAVSVTQDQPNRYAFGGTISDPGMGGSVNAFTGNFAVGGGARFDGGATDLAALVVIDSYTAPAPQSVVIGVTAQNGGSEVWGVRYDNTGAMVSHTALFYNDLQINSAVIDDLGYLYVPDRQETPNANSSTTSLKVYDTSFSLVDWVDFPGYQGFTGLSYSTATAELFTVTRYLPNNSVRVLRIDSATMLTTATGTFVGPACGNFCNSRILGGAMSPDGGTYVVYAAVNQRNDDDPGIHFLIKFSTLGAMSVVSSLDVTSLGAPSTGGNGVNMAVTNDGQVTLAFTTGGDTAKTYRFDASGASITQVASAAYGPIKVHFGGGIHNLDLDPATGHVFEVWESTTGAGDYMLLRYDQSLNLIGQRFYDGYNNTFEDSGFSVGVYNSSQVYVAGSVNNGQNIDWGYQRFNGNANVATSAAGLPVTITTSNAVNYIAGTVTYGGVGVTSGTVRMSLTPIYSEVPIRFATAPFSASSPFLFNNVPDGTYDIHAYVDPNGNQNPDAGEPVGVTSLYGIEFSAADGSQDLADPVQLCDRGQIAFGTPVLASLTAADCTSPDRTGAPRRLYTFYGTRGQPVTITMNALGFYDSYLDLYGPSNDWLEYDDDSAGNGDAQITNYVLPEDGLYTIDAGAYGSGSFGSFKLSLTGSAGALGGVSGRVNYLGSQGGSVVVGLFKSTSFSTSTTVGRLVLTSTRTFSFDNLAVGTTYYLGAFIDVNANNAPDAGEDSGVFGQPGAPNPLYLASGQTASGVEIAIYPSTASQASAAYVTGTASYAGARTGAMLLEFWSSSQFTGRPIASRVVPTGVGAYDVTVPGGVPYYVRAFIDANGDFALQPDEPRGVFAPHAQGAEQLFAPVGQTLVSVDIALKDPGVTASGAIAGEGSAVLTSTYAVSGGFANFHLIYTAGANGVTGGGTSGQVGFTVPPGFPYPSGVIASSTGPALSGVTYLGPSAFVTFPAGSLLPGQQVDFQWNGVYVPCAVGVATFTVSESQNNTAAPQSLFLGSPSLAVVPGAPSYVSLDEPYFSVKQDELSEVRRLVSYDNCGSKAPVTSTITVDLTARFFNGSSFVSDPAVGVATSVVQSTSTSLSLDFDVGASSRSFFVLAASTGFKYLEVHSNLNFGSTYYFGVSAVPANALTAVSISTASNGVALSSASITLAANGQPNQVFVNFTLGDPQQSWHVLVSSLPFKSGERPSAVWERWGFGQPNKGELAWDGRFSPWIQGGARVPNSLYYLRVELGGGGVKDDTIRVTVSLPQFSGTAYDPGTVPNPPLAGLQLSMYGPAGYYTATTGSDGSYVIPGLGAGNYRLNVNKDGYVQGGVDLTLNAGGSATSFVPRTPGVLVSSNATGGLDLFVSRAPRLVVVPSLDPSVGAVSADQWGSLQVRPSTSAQQQSTFYGPMRLKGGTTTFDDGGQWDAATQVFVARNLLGFNVPVGTYTVVGDLSGYSRSTGSVYVGPDGARLDLTPFVVKAVISGQVNLAAAAPPGGLPVGVSAVALTTATATSSLSAGTFVNAGSTYAVYSISGLDPGAYLLRANTQGLSAVTTGPLVIVGTTAVTGYNFPNFGAGVSISGTIHIGGGVPLGTKVYVNAWAPGSFNFGSTVVYTNASNDALYALNGLDSGITYQLYANVDAQGDYDVPGGFPRKDIPPLVDSFTLAPASGVISGTILLRAGSTDFTNVTLSGVTIASLHPDEVGHAFVQVSTALPNFLCGDGSSGATGYCPAGVSSATFRVQGVNTQTIDVRILHATTGQSSRHTVSAVNGSTFTFVSDLRASTYSISGFLINQIADPLFNTNAKILANAPLIAPQGYPAGISSTTARVVAVRQEIDSFGVAISTVFDPVSSRVGFLDASGNFTVSNIPNGAYFVRTADLRSCATCAIVAPSVGRLVSVSGAAVSSVTLTVSNGYAVSGTLNLDGGLLDAGIFNITVLNRRQEVVRSTAAYLGDIGLGQMSGSLDYAFTNLPAGEFYTLVVSGVSQPVKYAGRPIKFPDPALSPSGLQSNLVHQDVLLQRAAYMSGRLKDGGTGELIGASNATLLAPNFSIAATANPWTEGGFVAAASSVSARPIQADGYFRVGPLLPSVNYDLRLAQTSWDPNFLTLGSQNYAPVTIGGQKLTPGEVRDLGVISLGQGLSVTGVVTSTATGLPLGNVKVTAKPSFGGDDLLVQTYTSAQGVYSLWVSTLVSNQFTVTAAPRGGNQASDGKYYGTVALNNVNLQTQTSANFLLTPLTVVVTGQIVVADAATGGALSYPFGDKRGFPAAAVNLQPVGVVSNNPLGDIEATTDERGFYSVPGLSTGVYSLHATSLGYAVFNATVQVAGSGFHIFTGSNTASNDLPGGVATLGRGATATGRILKSDGSAPNSSEVVGVAAANFGSGEFVVGSVETDPVAKTVNAYTVSGFKIGVPYNIVLLSGSKGNQVSFPPEGAGVVFTAAESSTTKSINLTYRPALMDCLGTAKALDAARSQFTVQIDCLKPLRQETAADDDLTQILTVSTFTSLNAALTPPNGTGVLTGRAISTDRRRLTATYTLAVSETRFTMRVRAAASEVDPRTGDSFTIDKVFDFYAGLDAASDGRATNINGGFVGMQPSAQDELLGLDERSRIDLPPGAFGEGSDSLPDSSVVAQPTTTVNVSMTKGRDQQLAKALSIAAAGFAPAALSVPDVPSAYPAEMWAAMSRYRTQASTSTVGGANPLSAFYSIFLPAGIRHQLKQRADLTLSYNTSVSTGTTDDKIQVWFYNAVLGRFVLENTNRRLDSVNKTVTVSVDHFSTFVVLDSTPTATSTVTFGGTDIAVANFPNPADCVTHSNIARNSTLFGSGGVHAPFVGTMLRASIPNSGADAELRYNIYTVAGEKIRTIEQGTVPVGQTYYTPWNCVNDAGRTVASGVYIGEVIHGGRRKFFKIAIIKGSGL